MTITSNRRMYLDADIAKIQAQCPAGEPLAASDWIAARQLILAATIPSGWRQGVGILAAFAAVRMARLGELPYPSPANIEAVVKFLEPRLDSKEKRNPWLGLSKVKNAVREVARVTKP